MSAVIQVSTSGEIENVFVGGVADVIRLEMIGNGSAARRVTATQGSPSTILVSGNDVKLAQIVTGFSSADACIDVTGLRAQLTDISSSSSGSASAVRVSGADCVINGLTSKSDDSGLEIAGATRWQARGVNITDTDNEGVLITNSDHGIFEGVVYNSGRHGISISGSSYNRFSGQIIDAGKDTNNTYDGCIVAGDSNFNRTAFTVDYLGSGNQARYGINISAATVDGHIEASYIDAGATADFNDAGTGTVLTDDHIV